MAPVLSSTNKLLPSSFILQPFQRSSSQNNIGVPADQPPEAPPPVSYRLNEILGRVYKYHPERAQFAESAKLEAAILANLKGLGYGA